MNGYDRLKELYKASVNKNNPLKEIMKYLVVQPKMNDLYLQEEKNLKDMMDFINKKAKEQAVEGVAVIEDKQVFEWALEYFNNTNEVLGINKKTTTNIKPIKQETTANAKADNQLSLELDYDVY